MKQKCLNRIKAAVRRTFAAAAVTVLSAAAAVTAFAGNVEGNVRSINGPVEFTQPEKGEWLFRDGRWYFRSAEGEVRGRWACIEKQNGSRDWFCFDSGGAMCTGWQMSSGGNRYYLRETADERQGAMEKGFVLDAADGRCYYMDPSTGAMRTGWVSVEGNAYYFAEQGDRSAWYWDRDSSKWRSTGSGRPYGSMYRNETTPDGFMVDAGGRKVQ